MVLNKNIDQTDDCIDVDDIRPDNWPIEFYVCAKHKYNCYAEYDYAILDESKPCAICEPVESDSLGG